MNIQSIIKKVELIKHNLPLNEDGIKELDKIKQKQATKSEIRELEQWFVDYDRKVMENARCTRLGVSCEHNIIALDIQATEKQSRLKMLRASLNE